MAWAEGSAKFTRYGGDWLQFVCVTCVRVLFLGAWSVVVEEWNWNKPWHHGIYSLSKYRHVVRTIETAKTTDEVGDQAKTGDCRSHGVKLWYSRVQFEHAAKLQVECVSTAAPSRLRTNEVLLLSVAFYWTGEIHFWPPSLLTSGIRGLQDNGRNIFGSASVMLSPDGLYHTLWFILAPFLGLGLHLFRYVKYLFADQHTTKDQGSTIVQQFSTLVLGSMVSHAPVQPPRIECNQKAGSSAMHTKLAMIGWTESIQSTRVKKVWASSSPIEPIDLPTKYWMNGALIGGI